MNLSSVTPILDFMTFILVSVDVVTAFIVLLFIVSALNLLAAWTVSKNNTYE